MVSHRVAHPVETECAASITPPPPNKRPCSLPEGDSGTAPGARVWAATAEYEELVREAIRLLPVTERGHILSCLDDLKSRLAGAIPAVLVRGSSSRSASLGLLTPAPSGPAAGSSAPPAERPRHRQRYLGEVSDVHFFNHVESVLQHQTSGMSLDDSADEGAMDSYELDDAALPSAPGGIITLELPSSDLADTWLDAYFSTIHIAYPFVQKSTFMRTYGTVSKAGCVEAADRSWAALLCKPPLVPLRTSRLTGTLVADMTLAIGAYYTTFLGEDQEKVHEKYFERAMALSGLYSSERSTNQVSFLLSACFYLLAICSTDRFGEGFSACGCSG